MTRAEITTPEILGDESVVELSLRPQRLAEFIGQPKVKDSMRIYIDAALLRREPLDHTLFFGPAGLGKTTLAELIAREMGVNVRATSGPALEKPGDLVGTLTNLREGDILFIDEIHRLRPIIEEFLYPAMEDFKIDIRLSEGPKASVSRGSNSVFNARKGSCVVDGFSYSSSSGRVALQRCSVREIAGYHTRCNSTDRAPVR